VYRASAPTPEQRKRRMKPEQTSRVAPVVPVKHYENFPVASLLCPAHLRATIAAIYHFARTADDLADEGEVDAARRLADLQAYRADLHAAAQGAAVSARWRWVFAPLQEAIAAHHLPLALLHDLLDAFEQDVRFTAAQRRYSDDSELLDYCRRSANPVGRLLLHLYGVHDARSLAQSDQICSALQLINFWQDVRVDVAHGRWYIPQQAMARFTVGDAGFASDSSSKHASLLIASYADKARAMMLNGAPLVEGIPGRAAWELRLVVQGGLRILDKMAALDHATWRSRPVLTPWDAPLLLWRALVMRTHA